MQSFQWFADMKTQSNLPSEQIVQKFKALSETTENRMLWLTILKTVGRYPFIVTEKVRSVSQTALVTATTLRLTSTEVQKKYKRVTVQIAEKFYGDFRNYVRKKTKRER